MSDCVLIDDDRWQLDTILAKFNVIIYIYIYEQ